MKRASILVMVCCFAVGSWFAAAPGVDHDFAQWAPSIAAFEADDRVHRPAAGAFLFVGSSTIMNWQTLGQDFPHHSVINRGFGGSMIMDVTHYAERIVFPYQPRMIVLRSGANDLNNGLTPQQVFDDYAEFVRTVHARLPATRIVFISLCPTIARWDQRFLEKELNQLVATHVQNSPHLSYIEAYDMPLGPDGHPRPELFEEDGLHFNASGYQLLKERLQTVLPE